MRKDRSQIYAWVFTLAVLFVLILPNLLQDGMFMDGMLYACVSKNQAHGLGTFWFPHYSSTLYPFFDQQPPLGFGIQSVFFIWFGDSMYVERIYSLICAIITAFLITVLWRIFSNENAEIKKISWFPVLWWITVPVCFWAYSNNMLENTMCIFDLAAMIFIAKFLLRKQAIQYLLLAGSFVFLASLTKGIQGTFPLAAVFFGWVVYRHFSFGKMVLASLVMLLVPSLIFFLLVQDHNIRLSLSTYLNHRVLNSIQHVAEVQNRFYLAGRLLIELLPVLLATIVLVVMTFRKKQAQTPLVSPESKKHIFFLLLVGVSASLPLMVTLEQRGFYLVTSLPYYTMATALFAAPSLLRLLKRVNSPVWERSFGIFSVLFLCGVLVFSGLQTGKVGRDRDMLHDVYLIGQSVPEGTVLGSTRELWENWALQEYLVRYFSVEQSDRISTTDKYILVSSPESIPENIKAEKVDIPTIQFHLYKNIGIKAIGVN